MATAAAAEPEVVEEPKKKKPILLIIGGVVGLIVLIVGVVLGTLYFTGYFNPKPVVDPEHAEASADGHGAGDKKGDGKPTKKTKDAPELTRFENSYMDLEKPLVSNLTGTRKVIQVNLSIMTHYDERVFKNVKKHEAALRSAALDAMRQSTEAELSGPDFRKNLALKIRDEMNAVLTKYEDFGGIEEVFFTSFVVQ